MKSFHTFALTVVVLVSYCLIFAVATPALAQSWKVGMYEYGFQNTFSYNGAFSMFFPYTYTEQSDYPNSPTGGQGGGTIGPVEADAYNKDPYSGQPLIGPGELSQGNTSITNTGQNSATLTWTYPNGDPPPDHVDLLLDVDDTAFAATDYGSTGLTSGLSASDTTTDSLGGSATISESAPCPQGVLVNKFNKVLKRYDSSSGTVTVNVSGTVQSQATNSIAASYGSATSGAYGVVSATVSIDDREVTIDCPTIEPNYSKGPNDTQVQNVPASDGSMTADQAMSWTNNYGAGWWSGVDTFNVSATGFLSPESSWSQSTVWSQSGSALVALSNPQAYDGTTQAQLPFIVHNPSGSQALGGSNTVTCSVTDVPPNGDGAVGTGTYAIRWHYPMENWNNYSSGTAFWQPSSLQSQTSANYNGNANCTYETTDAEGGWNTALADMFTAGSGLVDPPWAAFLTAAGLFFSSIQPSQPISTSVNFNDAWGNGPGPGVLSTWNPAPADNTPATMEMYSMEPEIFAQYIPQYFKGDGWGTNGYTGQVYENYDQFTGRIQDAGSFSLNQE